MEKSWTSYSGIGTPYQGVGEGERESLIQKVREREREREVMENGCKRVKGGRKRGGEEWRGRYKFLRVFGVKAWGHNRKQQLPFFIVINLVKLKSKQDPLAL